MTVWKTKKGYGLIGGVFVYQVDKGWILWSVFMSTRHKIGSSGNKESKLRKRLYNNWPGDKSASHFLEL